MAKIVFAASDFSGETAGRVARATTSQFVEGAFTVVIVPGIRTEKQIDRLIKRSKEESSVIFHTLVKPDLRDYLVKKASEAKIPHFDVFGPAFDIISKVASQKPRLQPGPAIRLDTEYFNWVEAVQFAVRHDDGADTVNLDKGDLVLIGVSRTGKTPLTIYLAYRGWKVGNVPLIYGFKPPKEIFEIDSRKVIGLSIDAEHLAGVRNRRLSFFSDVLDARYAKPAYIHLELKYGREIMNKIGCHVIDVTGKAVEETAQEILIYFKGLKGHEESLV